MTKNDSIRTFQKFHDQSHQVFVPWYKQQSTTLYSIVRAGPRALTRSVDLQGGHNMVVDYLLQHNANPNARDIKGETPLHKAAQGGHVDVIAALVAAGADAARVAGTSRRTPRQDLAQYHPALAWP